MPKDDHYPTIDSKFMKELVESSDKILGSFTSGETITYVRKGNTYIGKRIINLKVSDQELDYIYCTGIALLLNRVGMLLDWLVENRNWKDGAYIVKEENSQTPKEKGNLE